MARRLLFIWLFIILFGVFQSIVVETVNAADVKADLDSKVEIGDEKSSVDLGINISNISSDKVITEFSLPNIWKSKKLLKNTEGVEITKESINIDISKSGILPGKDRKLELLMDANVYENIAGNKYIFSEELRSGGIDFKKIELAYPKNWGIPSYVSLKADKYVIQDVDDQQIVQITPQSIYPQLEIVWGVDYEIELTAISSSEDKTQHIIATSPNQHIFFPEDKENSFSEVYMDKDLNILADYFKNETEVNILVKREKSDLSGTGEKFPVRFNFLKKSPRFMTDSADLYRYCDEERKCHYELIDKKVLKVYEQERVYPIGYELFNNSILSIQSDTKLKRAEYYELKSTGTEVHADIDVDIILPTRVYNLKPTDAQLVVKNESNTVIFPQKLKIFGKDLFLADEDQLLSAIKPGESRSYKINNLLWRELIVLNKVEEYEISVNIATTNDQFLVEDSEEINLFPNWSVNLVVILIFAILIFAIFIIYTSIDLINKRFSLISIWYKIKKWVTRTR